MRILSLIGDPWVIDGSGTAHGFATGTAVKGGPVRPHEAAVADRVGDNEWISLPDARVVNAHRSTVIA